MNLHSNACCVFCSWVARKVLGVDLNDSGFSIYLDWVNSYLTTFRSKFGEGDSGLAENSSGKNKSRGQVGKRMYEPHNEDSNERKIKKSIKKTTMPPK